MLRKAILLVIAAPAILLTSCATPGAPMPPSLQLPRPIEDLNYARKGSRVVLTWTPPTQTTEHLGMRHLGVTYICRSIDHYPVNNCDMLKRLTAAEVEKVTDKKRESAVFEDHLEQGQPGAFATYSIEVFNDRGRTAGLSNQVRVPLAPTLPAPQDLKVTVTAQGPVLEWQGASMNPARDLSVTYRIFRRAEKVPAFTMVDDVRADSGPMQYLDRSFEWEKTYQYKVTPVTHLAAGATTYDIEGEDSPVISVQVKDIFPPSRPVGVQAVFSGVGQKAFIDLTWSPNPETDLAGYLVFRREAGGAPVKLNDQPVQAPSFRDANVQAGAKYSYSVVAVDLRGNQSPPSEEASESVPSDLH